MELCLGQPSATVPAAVNPSPKLEDGLYAAIQTSAGEIKVKLFEKEAPVTVKNFVDLALGRKTYIDPRNELPSKKPFYSGLTFHRVIPEFMIQGGDPLGNGAGGTAPIKDEIVPDLKFDVPGRMGMANSGPNTGSCQFFLTELPQPHLDGLHTIFGQVVDGMDVIKKIARMPVDGQDHPIEPVKIVEVRVARIGPPPQAAKPAAPRKAPSKSTSRKAPAISRKK
jgi:peptidyl-prolyl cis-trans isomerase A (cyclophilin A)